MPSAAPARPSAPMNTGRTYQRGWSNARMKLTRYSARGSTQRNGTLEMFCVMWLVTASSITDPMADRRSHCSCDLPGTGELATTLRSTSTPFIDSHAVMPQSSANPANRNDQPQPSAVKSNAGSNSTGKPSSASSDARLESANSRYGTALWKRRQYQAWSERRGGRKQEVRQADRRHQQAAGCAGSAARRPAASSRSRPGSAG